MQEKGSIFGDVQYINMQFYMLLWIKSFALSQQQL